MTGWSMRVERGALLLAGVEGRLVLTVCDVGLAVRSPGAGRSCRPGLLGASPLSVTAGQLRRALACDYGAAGGSAPPTDAASFTYAMRSPNGEK
jgi:hypothetical protein